MIKSCVTISLVEQARGGPFVYWDDLGEAARQAQELGFDAIEVFAPTADAVPEEQLRSVLKQTGLQLAAVGTGAGWVVQRLSLTDPQSAGREKAKAFIRSMIDFGGSHGAVAIIGSMQGRYSDEVDRDTALGYLRDALEELGEYAVQYQVPLIYEHLNRYETNLINTVTEGVAQLKQLSTTNVKLLADLFHMNIEEANLADAIRTGADCIGHVHFVDSNRQAAGRGHMDYAPIAQALKEIRYDGYASAEAFPIPNSEQAARQTIESFKEFFS